MNLIRCKDQKSGTLDEFYTKLITSGNHCSKGIGKAMLDLIVRLRALPDERQIFGLTSHYNLCLLAEDTYESLRLVNIYALDERNYFIEYRMTNDAAPWPNAYVKGVARSEDDAIRMIVIGLEKSGGWNSGENPVQPNSN
jgi:hypothetical protein